MCFSFTITPSHLSKFVADLFDKLNIITINLHVFQLDQIKRFFQFFNSRQGAQDTCHIPSFNCNGNSLFKIKIRFIIRP